MSRENLQASFTDAQFMSAAEKAAFIKAWTRFLAGGLKRSLFTDRIYKHLSLHHGFIAHYNIDGFYEARFENPAGRRATFLQLMTPAYPALEDYKDVIEAMQGVLRVHLRALQEDADRKEIAYLEDVAAKVAARLRELKGEK